MTVIGKNLLSTDTNKYFQCEILEIQLKLIIFFNIKNILIQRQVL